MHNNVKKFLANKREEGWKDFYNILVAAGQDSVFYIDLNDKEYQKYIDEISNFLPPDYFVHGLLDKITCDPVMVSKVHEIILPVDFYNYFGEPNYNRFLIISEEFFKMLYNDWAEKGIFKDLPYFHKSYIQHRKEAMVKTIIE